MPNPEDMQSPDLQSTATFIMLGSTLFFSFLTKASLQKWGLGSQGLRACGNLVYSYQLPMSKPGSLPFLQHSSGLIPRKRIQIFGGFWWNFCPVEGGRDSIACWVGHRGEVKDDEQGSLGTFYTDLQLPGPSALMLGARPLVVGGGSETAPHCIRPISPKSQVAPPGSPCVVYLLFPWVP